MRPRVMLVTSGGLTGSLSHYAYTLSDWLQDEFDFSFLCDGDFFPDREAYRSAFEADQGLAFRIPTFRTLARVAYLGLRERRRHQIVHILTQRYFGLAKDPSRDIITVADIFPFGLREIDETLWRAECSGLPYRLRNASLRWTVRRAGRRRLQALTFSRYTKDQLTRYFEYPTERVESIPFLLDRRYLPVPRLEARRRLGIPDGARVVLSVGANLPRKNLAALYHLINTIETPTTFLKLGEVDTKHITPERRSWLRAVRTVPTQDLGAYYGAADVLFFPSFAEGFGVPLLEAMAAGLPIVAAKGTSTDEVAGDGALFAGAHDVERLTALVAALLNSPGQREEIGRKGLLQAQKLSADRASDAIRETYRRVNSSGS